MDADLESRIQSISYNFMSLAHDVTKIIPFSKLLIDRQNYKFMDAVMDVEEILLLISAANTHVFRQEITIALLGTLVAGRYYNEIKHDFSEKYTRLNEFFNSKIKTNNIYKLFEKHLQVIDKVVTDGYTIPLLPAGFALATGISLVYPDFENNSSTFLNMSSPQHFITGYVFGNLFRRVAEEYNMENSWVYKAVSIAAMALFPGIWEVSEFPTYNYKVIWDTVGDVTWGVAGWNIHHYARHEEVVSYLGSKINEVSDSIKGLYKKSIEKIKN